MLEFFQYATSGFWVFVGVFLLLALIGKLIVALSLGLVAIMASRGHADINIE